MNIKFFIIATSLFFGFNFYANACWHTEYLKDIVKDEEDDIDEEKIGKYEEEDLENYSDDDEKLYDLSEYVHKESRVSPFDLLLNRSGDDKALSYLQRAVAAFDGHDYKKCLEYISKYEDRLMRDWENYDC